MTILDCIRDVDSYEDNAYTIEQKARWVREVEGKVYTQLFLQQPLGFHVTQYAKILDYELAIPAPLNQIYRDYLQAKIHYANGEYDRYANSMAMFNDGWNDLNIWFGNDYDITDRQRNRRITVRIGCGPQDYHPEPTPARLVQSVYYGPEYMKLLTVPERCAFVAGRVVVKRPFEPRLLEDVTLEKEAPEETKGSNDSGITGELWFGDPDQPISSNPVKLYKTNTSGMKMLIGDVGGTDLGITISAPSDGEAYLTGILCLPKEEYFYDSEIRGRAVPIHPVVEEWIK